MLPETGKRAARAAADRLCARVRELRDGARAMTVSCGVASFPNDAPNVTEFLAAADAALYAAKERGKDRAATYTAAVRAGRPAGDSDAVQVESLKQFQLLGGLAAKLNRLNDVTRIGETIVADLAGMVDYDNARVYVLDGDGALEPIAFRGSIDEYSGETLEGLRVAVGEGITGMAALRGKTLNVPDANACPFAADIPGTDELEESILAVPLMYDRRATGVVGRRRPAGRGRRAPDQSRALVPGRPRSCPHRRRPDGDVAAGRTPGAGRGTVRAPRSRRPDTSGAPGLRRALSPRPTP